MKLIEDFRDKQTVVRILNAIKSECRDDRSYRIMEVCGTHTMSISRFGIRSVLPKNISLISGPGCPVCVTSQGELDVVFRLLLENDVVLTTFGDLMKVPGSDGQTLLDYRAEGHDIRIVTSPLDCVDIANSVEKEVVFVGIGFETTAPTIAGMVSVAKQRGIDNLSVIPFLKTMPEVMALLLADDEMDVDGFLCPGHVSAITGEEIYYPIVDSGRGAVITGFEPVDILNSVYHIIKQVNENTFSIKNLYSRAVCDDGNPVALKVLYSVFEPCDAEWRGIGCIENSGLKFKDEYGNFDALRRFDVEIVGVELETGCRCGEVLKGKIVPNECALFGGVCTPESPTGPCMVSTEGACAAYYKYGT